MRMFSFKISTWNSKANQFFMVGHQLDDEPNLYMGNGWKSPFPSIYKWLALEFQVYVFRSQLFFGNLTKVDNRWKVSDIVSNT